MPRQKNKQRRVMKEFVLDELSAVDCPAQEGAKMTIMKRSNTNRKEAGGSVDMLTGETDGHQHGITIRRRENGLDIWVMHAQSSEDDHGHDHQIVLENGKPIVTMNAGHTHDIDQEAYMTAAMEALSKLADSGESVETLLKTAARLGVSNQSLPKKSLSDALLLKGELSDKTAGPTGSVGTEDTMTDKKQAADRDAAIEKLQEELAVSKAINELDDAQRAYYRSLEEDSRKAFLAKTADERIADMDAIAKAAQEADPVVYKTSEGIEIRKSAGPAVEAIARSNDTKSAQIATLIKARETDAYEKRADDELAHLPGSTAERAALLKSIDAIEDEDQRAAALRMVKAGSEASSFAFKTVGHRIDDMDVDNGSVSTAEAELHRLTEEQMNKFSKNANGSAISYAQAYNEVLKTARGHQLYHQSLN